MIIAPITTPTKPANPTPTTFPIPSSAWVPAPLSLLGVTAAFATADPDLLLPDALAPDAATEPVEAGTTVLVGAGIPFNWAA